MKVLNPQYQGLGDSYWTPEILLTTWYQAETGKIPVSGAGYGGPFTGPGFDSFWTDMSEIVRPTRDGIHGREYISTAVDLGRKPMFLIFDDRGEVAFSPPPLVEIPLPVLLGEPPLGAAPAKTPTSSAGSRRITASGRRARPRIPAPPSWSAALSWHARAAPRSSTTTPLRAASPAAWTWTTISCPRSKSWKFWIIPVFWGSWTL